MTQVDQLKASQAWMKQARLERGWSLRDLARETGISLATLHRTEQGQTSPYSRVSKILAEKLEIQPPSTPTDADASVTIHQLLHLERLSRHLTLRDLAQLTRLSISTLSELEKGTTIPKISTLERLSEALQIDPVFLGKHREAALQRKKILKN